MFRELQKETEKEKISKTRNINVLASFVKFKFKKAMLE